MRTPFVNARARHGIHVGVRARKEQINSRVADYVLIKDSGFAFGAPLVTHNFPFTVPANTHLGSRSIL